ncbi:flavin reductase like domain-containing protein [Microdochium trichocladiopsis]|uniref:Flavin reductase like domain-containing protein n=1 Tax=Microdochium trichocladiopsis TaxID=1682393 RepID=A0A9P8YBI3_9PEZI|nr:flavin reductase like domain-containing protein [Microdochium trichocladiopsis]KAH7033083.1 flavin reductase like domain-containing protein [Microdochium trichocladiopsis]
MRHVPHPVVVITALDCPALSPDDHAGKRTARIPDHWADTEIPSSISRHDQVGDPRILAPLPRAMTASSFTSLTLDPTPTILFNVTIPSRSHSAILRAGSFNVHILSADEHGAKLADLFARGYSSANSVSATSTSRQEPLGVLAGLKNYGVDIAGQLQWEEAWAASLKQKSPSIRPSADSFPAPLLQGPGILHVLKCKLVDLQSLETTEARCFALVAGQVTEVVSANEPDHSMGEHQTALSYVDGAYRGPSPAIMRHSVSANSQ